MRRVTRRRGGRRESDDGAGLLSGLVNVGRDAMSEARFRHIAEALPQILWISSASGQIEYQNGRLAEYAGRAPVDPDETTEIVHPDDRASRFARWDEARRGGAYECEYRMRRRDGEYRWFLGRALAIRDATGQVVRWYGCTTDIHDLKMAQEASREAGRRKDQFLAVLSHELRNPLAPIKSALFLLDRTDPGSDQARKARSIIARQVDQLVRLVDDLLDATRISRGKVDLAAAPSRAQRAGAAVRSRTIERSSRRAG